LIGATVRQTLRRFGLNSGWLANQVESRLVVMQGFLHSDDSSRIAITLRNSPGARLELKADLNQGVKATVRKVVRKLLRNAWHLGAVPVQPMVQIAEPGRSFHSGGTFPMRLKPTANESDILGRPAGWQRVHAVDATVLPSVPATTITFSVMANAHRIAWESATLD
jgi:hypothetical protein